jgi:AcrR family transcriptional regulator
MPAQSSRKSHHHGDLREALIAAGLRLLEEGGPEALTLRRAAALAGVSHAAPAHHFAGLPGLHRAIADEGFRRFRNYMVDARLAGEQSPRGHLLSICRGYFRFARDNRALFGLMFGFSTSERQPKGISDIGSYAYGILRAACAPFVPDDTEPEVTEAQVWSLIHGFTSLYLSGRFWGEAHNAQDVLFAPVMELLDRIGTAP